MERGVVLVDLHVLPKDGLGIRDVLRPEPFSAGCVGCSIVRDCIRAMTCTASAATACHLLRFSDGSMDQLMVLGSTASRAVGGRKTA